MAENAVLTQSDSLSSSGPIVSVIVPVYKVEQYLRRCLESIAAQTFTSWECILIDDGSPDASGAICDEYAARDARFRVIHQKNAGVSAARNAGMDASLGEWLTFVDSDDWVAENYLFCLYEAALANSADIVVSGLSFTDGNKILKNKFPAYGRMNLPKDFAVYLQGPWAKLYSTQFCTRYACRFPLGVAMGEDMAFTFQAFFHAKVCWGIKESLYFYYQNAESAVHNVTNKMCADELGVIGQMEQKILQTDKTSEWNDFLLDRKCRAKNHFILQLKKPDFKTWRATYPEVNDYMMHNFPLHIKLFCFFVSHKLDLMALMLLKIKRVYKWLKK